MGRPARPERVYAARELRAVAAMALGLIGGGVVMILVALFGWRNRVVLLLGAALILCGGALQLRVRQEANRTHDDDIEKTFE